MKTIFTVILISFCSILVISSNGIVSNNSKAIVSDTSLYIVSVKIESDYSPSFLSEIRKSKWSERVKLIDSLMIIGKDTSLFPQDLTQGKQYRFTAKRNTLYFALVLKRINQTTLQYTFTIDSSGIILHNRNGVAILNSGFWGGGEPSSDDEDNEEFYVSEYFDKNQDGWFIIQIGHGRNKHGWLRSNIKQWIRDTSKIKELPNIPTLKTK